MLGRVRPPEYTEGYSPETLSSDDWVWADKSRLSYGTDYYANDGDEGADERYVGILQLKPDCDYTVWTKFGRSNFLKLIAGLRRAETSALEPPSRLVDHTDPEAVCRAFISAWEKHDADALTALANREIAEAARTVRIAPHSIGWSWNGDQFQCDFLTPGTDESPGVGGVIRRYMLLTKTAEGSPYWRINVIGTAHD